MATSVQREPNTWRHAGRYTVTVQTDEERPMSESVAVLRCFETDKHVDLKSMVEKGIYNVIFPVPIFEASQSQDKLRETFRKLSQKDSIVISLDSVKSWTKRDFCRTVLTEFLQNVTGAVQREHEIMLTFCTTESHSFDEAVKVCEKKMALKKQAAVGSDGVHVTVVKGCLDAVTADVLACTISPSLDLNQGAVSKALLKHYGKELQRDVEKLYGKQLAYGELAIVPGYKLKCKYVYFGVMQSYSKKYAEKYNTDKDYYRSSVHEFIVKCLNEAEHSRCHSIAFPAIGAGNLGYPVDVVADQMFVSVENWSNEHTVTSLRDVRFVIFPSDENALLEFSKAERKHDNSPMSSNIHREEHNPNTPNVNSHKTSLYPHGNPRQSHLYPYCHRVIPPGRTQSEFFCCFGEGQNMYIYSGNILSMKAVKIIVCGNDRDGKTTGKLAKALSDKGGNTYRQAKDKKFKKEANFGDVVLCDSGDLKNFEWIAHAILHKKVDCKGEEDRIQKLNSVFKNIFTTMKDKQCNSLALPLIGTGQGKGDPKFCAERVFGSLLNFSQFNKTYRFSIHLVQTENAKTWTAIDTVKKAVQEAHQMKVEANQPKPQRSAATTRERPVSAQPRSQPKSGYDHMLHNHGATSFDSKRGQGGRNKTCAKSSMSSSSNRYQNKRENDSTGSHSQCVSHGTKHAGVGKEYSIQNEKRMMGSDVHSIQQEDFLYTRNSDTNTDEEKNIENTDERIAENVMHANGNLNIILDDDDMKSDEKIESDDETGKKPDMEEKLEESDDETGKKPDMEEKTCVICMDTITNPSVLPCGHMFCSDCIKEQFSYKPACPTCGKVCGTITGDQPKGRMEICTNKMEHCVGFEAYGRIEIMYRFRDGIQGPSHPLPGTRYKGITRTAYLPDNKKGREIRNMLVVAFHRDLVFTIGRSRTTGADGVITWNDIHHKTDPKPNTQFGYPDPTYLDRVTEELEVKGITVNDIYASPEYE